MTSPLVPVPAPAPTPSLASAQVPVTPLSSAARRVHEHMVSHQLAAIVLSQPEAMENQATFENAFSKVHQHAMRAALAYDLFSKRSPLFAAPPPPAPPATATAVASNGPALNADGTPQVWPRPSRELVAALSLLRSVAEDPPKSLDAMAEKIAPIQAFLKAFDDAQPRI
jgi:hypothetical protein